MSGRPRVALCTLSQSVRAPTGLLSYFAQLARFLPAVDQAAEYHFVVSAGNRGFIAQGAPDARFHELGWDNDRRALRVLSEHFLLGPWLARERIDLLYMANAGVRPLLLPRGIRLVQAVFAFHHLNRHEIARAASLYRRLFFRRSVARADRIVLNSDYSREVLLGAAPVDPARIRIIPHGRNEQLFHERPLDPAEAAGFAALGLPEPYVAFVSQMYPYKSVHTAVEGFCRFIAAAGAPHALVLVGQFDRQFGRGEAYRRELVALAGRHGLADRLVFREGLPVKVLRAVYRRASAYVQPSLSETFGRTSLEAMACGCPVVAARAAATPEVVGDAGLYFAPGDAAGCAEALLRLLGEPGLAEALAARGLARAERFSIAEEARQLAGVFHETMAGSAPARA